MAYILGFIMLFMGGSQAPDSGNDPLHEILQHLEQQTGYRFLYKDALVANKTGYLTYSENWQSELLDELEKWDLSAKIDSSRKQVIIYASQRNPVSVSAISGEIIDKLSGEQLPFATVALISNSGTQSITQSDQHGRYRIPVPEGEEEFTVRVSYIGYDSYELNMNRNSIDSTGQIHIRLSPSAYEISEIVVTGSGSGKSDGSVYRGMLEAGSFSAAGEANAVRMLSVLPSVNSGTSLSDGAHIRGSNSDALNVLLDGSVIYNRSHLFGLIDSFNSDIIRTGNFYYDVAPAKYHAPPGGVLSLVTKSGSLHSYGGGLGLSSTVVKGSLEGPIRRGQSSFMIAARHSIIDQVNIFGLDDMIAWGLDTDRPSSLSDDIDRLEDRISRPLDSSAQFFDFHGKVFIENSEGSRWALSGYAGGDRTSQQTERLVRTGFNSPGNRFDLSEFLTKNTWGNRSFNISNYRNTGFNNSFLHFQGGYSYYYTEMLKEDFVYQRPSLNEGQQLLFVDNFENESELNHVYVSGEFNSGMFTGGVSLNFFDSAYLENSLGRQDFFQGSGPFMPEVYVDLTTDESKSHTIQGGVRVQYYSDGDYLNLSPRVKLSLFRNNRISAAVGFSRNYQYLYKLSIYNLSAADIWITAVPEQPPTLSDLLSGGVYVDMWSGAKFQAEAYFKWQQNIRYHEINIQNLDTSFENQPWFSDNDGYASGLELLFSQRFGKAAFTQSYTWSVSQMRNERLNSGEWFYTEWDRTHQFKTLFQFTPAAGLDLHLSWTYLSGAPDRLTLFEDTPERLGDYIRTDLSISYSAELSGAGVVLRANMYNLTGRNNPWYREWVPVVTTEAGRTQLRPVQADIYDLGFQPSFTAKINF
ncbi:TonB-dependent receptor [Rhodohalobacter mucosus]|uniref:Uncharacterized protein n=1 Tax=Rhodohalobacter mucosus TaxID=2079485 RepID=A0A316TV96_9BACT|nr:TonB-dependent receptor [Rhodohalobacter mucosus]PWN07701.1 hypothetical protein DDZ15_01375 [Rhodohalobacter mucosus]